MKRTSRGWVRYSGPSNSDYIKHEYNTTLNISDTADRLQPTQHPLDAATDKARIYWHNLAEQALARHKNGALPQHVTLKDILYRVPAIPTTPTKPE